MKRIIAALLALLLATPSFAALGRGKTGTGDQTSGDSSLTYAWTGAGSTTAGSTIVVGVATTDGFARTYSVSDSASNVYSSSYTYAIGNTSKMYVFYCENASAASSITVTASGWEQFVSCALEITGAATSAARDKTIAMYDNSYAGGESWTASATGALTQANEMVVVFLCNAYINGAVTAYAATGYTADAFIYGSAILDKIVSATDSVTPAGTLTLSTGDYWVGAGVMTFKDATAGGGGTVVTGDTSPITIMWSD